MKRSSNALSPETLLRLRVMMSQCEAIRIDEALMVVHGLSGERQFSVEIRGDGSSRQLLRATRDTLSSLVTQSAGAYPQSLGRWTRLGQFDSRRLGDLLMLGDPGAVIAVASAATLDATVASRAWWAHTHGETARFLLGHEAVRGDPLADRLVDYLLEHLPFETSSATVVETVRLLALAQDAESPRLRELWARGRRNAPIRLGFVRARPFELPSSPNAGNSLRHGQVPARDAPTETWLAFLQQPQAKRLFETIARILEHAADQDVVVGSLEALADALAPVRSPIGPCENTESIHRAISDDVDTRSPRDAVPSTAVDAIRFLSLVGEPLVREYFAHSTAQGAQMRRQLAPLLDPVLNCLRIAAR